MHLNGEEYSKRLEAYSYDTLLLISEGHMLPREWYLRAQDITTNSELNEEQVAEGLRELLRLYEEQKQDTTP